MADTDTDTDIWYFHKLAADTDKDMTKYPYPHKYPRIYPGDITTDTKLCPREREFTPIEVFNYPRPRDLAAVGDQNLLPPTHHEVVKRMPGSSGETELSTLLNW